jgi:hypothetical protein
MLNLLLVLGLFVPFMVSTPITSIDVAGKTLSVVQQNGSWYFVSDAANTVTQFELSRNLTFLAHDNLAGEYFTGLKVGDAITVGNDTFYVTELNRYQVVKTDYTNLDTGYKLTETEISYLYYYMRPDTLVLQTCIERFGNYQWGRLFIRAEKKTPFANCRAAADGAIGKRGGDQC